MRCLGPILLLAALATSGAVTACSSSRPLLQRPPDASASASPSTGTAPPASPTEGPGGRPTSSDAPIHPSSVGSSSSPGAASATSGSAVPTGPATAVTTGYTAPPLTWRACEGGATCATLTVPVDYARPGGATLGVVLIRRTAQDKAQRIGSLVVNPGGPGASGYEFVRDSSDVFSDAVRGRFDVVGFDPRGVGRSRGVDCATDGQLDAFFHADAVPVSPAVRRTYTQASKAFADRCAGSAGALLSHIGTVEAARDLDVLRVALREEKLTFFGYSYGTYLGATYAELFPTRLRAAVLDGAVDPSLDLVGFVQGQAKAFEAALGRWFAWCTQANGCDLGSTGPRTVQQRFDAVSAAVRRAPLTVGRRSLGPGEFSYGVGYAMYSRSLWPQLGGALASAERGEGSALLALSDSYTRRTPDGHYDNSTDANYAVNCLDHQGPRTEQGWYDAAVAVGAAAPRLGEGIVYNTLPCAYWRVPARPVLSVHAAGAPPIVVVGTTHDPATPYAWAQSLAHQLASGVLLTFDGDGHTAYGPQSPCVQRVVDRYLTQLAAPAKGTRC